MAPPQGPRERGAKMCLCMCIHVSSSNTKFDWIVEKFNFWPPVPPGAWPRRPTETPFLICFISFICDKTHRVWFKKYLKLTLELNFNDIWPFGPSPGSGAKNIGHIERNPGYVAYEQLRHRPSWSSAQLIGAFYLFLFILQYLKRVTHLALKASLPYDPI